ncbi:cyclic nucleotide-binding domain-containing protein [bacterium]|nr:cyclic nucleotide-binding domain-containing protein [bacterium]
METNQLRNIIRRIPILHGFTNDQVERVIDACREEAFGEGTSVFQESDEPQGIYILLSGLLQVQTPTGGEIATIGEMGVVGEMGVLTGEPRAASVVALRDSKTLCIGKQALFELMDSDKDTGYKIYQNVTHILADRLRDNNILLEQQYLVLDDLVGGGRGGA